MDIKTDGITIPAPGYALIEQIKAVDGRIDYLTEWTTEIKNYIKADLRTSRTYDGMEMAGAAGKRRLRVIQQPRVATKTFDYGRFSRAVSPDVFRSVVRTTPPKYPCNVRIAAVGGAKRVSHEWTDLALVGRKEEAARYDSRSTWKDRGPRIIASGLFALDERIKEHQKTRLALRDELRAMATEGDWARHSMLMGKFDGRLFMPKAPVTHELIDRDMAMRQYASFVNHGQRAAHAVVGFYPISEGDGEE